MKMFLVLVATTVYLSTSFAYDFVDNAFDDDEWSITDPHLRAGLAKISWGSLECAAGLSVNYVSNNWNAGDTMTFECFVDPAAPYDDHCDLIGNSSDYDHDEIMLGASLAFKALKGVSHDMGTPVTVNVTPKKRSPYGPMFFVSLVIGARGAQNILRGLVDLASYCIHR